jgi:hypothetical protein
MGVRPITRAKAQEDHSGHSHGAEKAKSGKAMLDTTMTAKTVAMNMVAFSAPIPS